jgi:hypothetical protein
MAYMFSQKYTEPGKSTQFNITVNFDDYTVKTQILGQEKKVCVEDSKTYMWYASRKIVETKGGYSGRLIHGTYTSFYLNDQLRDKGYIKYGLRDKEWRYWYPDGKLKEIIRWKSGAKHGRYLLYNDLGELMAKGNFKNDKLHGAFYTYGGRKTVLEKKRYKNGEEVIAKTKTASEKTADKKQRGKRAQGLKTPDKNPDNESPGQNRLKKNKLFKKNPREKTKRSAEPAKDAPANTPAKST